MITPNKMASIKAPSAARLIAILLSQPDCRWLRTASKPYAARIATPKFKSTIAMAGSRAFSIIGTSEYATPYKTFW